MSVKTISVVVKRQWGEHRPGAKLELQDWLARILIGDGAVAEDVPEAPVKAPVEAPVEPPPVECAALAPAENAMLAAPKPKKKGKT